MKQSSLPRLISCCCLLGSLFLAVVSILVLALVPAVADDEVNAVQAAQAAQAAGYTVWSQAEGEDINLYIAKHPLPQKALVGGRAEAPLIKKMTEKGNNITASFARSEAGGQGEITDKALGIIGLAWVNRQAVDDYQLAVVLLDAQTLAVQQRWQLDSHELVFSPSLYLGPDLGRDRGRDPALGLDRQAWLAWSVLDGDNEDVQVSYLTKQQQWSAPIDVHADNTAPDILPIIGLNQSQQVAVWWRRLGVQNSLLTALWQGPESALGPATGPAFGSSALDQNAEPAAPDQQGSFSPATIANPLTFKGQGASVYFAGGASLVTGTVGQQRNLPTFLANSQQPIIMGFDVLEPQID